MTNKEAMQKLFSILHDDRFSWTQESVDAFYVALEKLKNATEELKNSNDCISRAEAIAVHDPLFEAHAIERIKKLPSAQPEIVMCKDCKHWINGHLCENLSRFGSFETKEDFYCGCAKRRTDA